MRRILSLAVLSVLVAGGVFAGGAPEEPATDRVVAYTAHEDTIINEMTARFTAETGMEIEFIKLGSSEVIQRAVAEADNPRADVIWSIGGEALEANSSILEPYTPEAWDQIDDVFKVGTNWLPYTGIMNVFVVNTDMVPENLTPRTWTDLTDDRLEGLISSARADRSGSSYMQLANVLAIYGEDEGWEIFTDILENMALSASSGAVPRFVNDGEAAVGLTLEDNAQRFVAGGGPVKIVYPEDGTVAAPDGIAMLKGAPHPDAAKAFIDWTLSKSTQDFLVEAMGRRSVRTDGTTPPGLPPLSEINTVAYDFEWAAGNRERFIETYTEKVIELGM
ncbi:MAG: extracellular solute-binding protein [Spirochaetota bacterium]